MRLLAPEFEMIISSISCGYKSNIVLDSWCIALRRIRDVVIIGPSTFGKSVSCESLGKDLAFFFFFQLFHYFEFEIWR